MKEGRWHWSFKIDLLLDGAASSPPDSKSGEILPQALGNPLPKAVL